MEIKLDDGSIVRIGPKTTMVLSEYSEDSAQVKSTSVNVFMGRVWANVAKPLKGDAKFKIATPSAIAAVKGTVYRADVSDSTSQINVYDGTVSVQKTDGGESIDITKLEMLIALPATALEKSPFDEKDDEKDEWIRWNKSRDKLRVMIIIPEKRAGEKALSSMAESKMIEKFLQNYLFRDLTNHK